MDDLFKKIKNLSKSGLSLEEIAEEVDLSVSTMNVYFSVIKQGFKSVYEYQEHLIKQRGFKSYHEYGEYLIKQNGFKSVYEYQEHLIKQRGFKSYHEYQEHLAKERQKRQENKKLRNLIKKELKNIGKNQSWLAEKTGVTRQAVSLYAQGKAIPNEELLKRLFNILRLPYKTLDDILK